MKLVGDDIDDQLHVPEIQGSIPSDGKQNFIF